MTKSSPGHTKEVRQLFDVREDLKEKTCSMNKRAVYYKKNMRA